jgi:hypothetical protein
MATQIRMRELTRVFGPGAPFSARYIAQLSVLYEDLRIETTAIAQDSMPALDVTDCRYRRHYFLRRSIATLVEFAEGLRLLDSCPDFRDLRSGFDKELIERWTAGIRFFYKTEQFLKLIRNDSGGHFGPDAAGYAVTHLNNGAVGKIQMEDESRAIHLHFAGEIAATAILRHLKDQDTEAGFKPLLKTVLDGYRHATTCVHCLVVSYLWPRFG